MIKLNKQNNYYKNLINNYKRYIIKIVFYIEQIITYRD